MKARYYIGLDLGQRRDPAACAVVERSARRKSLRYLERFALMTPYPEIVERIGRMELPGPATLAVDGTGVGAAVADMIRASRMAAEFRAVVVTSGKTERREGNTFFVPKGELMAGLGRMLNEGKLRIAEGLEEAETLVKEMRGMEIQVGSRGRERYTARAGIHDDVVYAVALACWACNRALL